MSNKKPEWVGIKAGAGEKVHFSKGGIHDLKVPAKLSTSQTKNSEAQFSLHDRVSTFILKSLPSSVWDRLSEKSASQSGRHLWLLFCFCLEGSHSGSVQSLELCWLMSPAEGHDLWVPIPEREVCFTELVIWSDWACSLVTRVLIQTDVKMNTLSASDDQ